MTTRLLLAASIAVLAAGCTTADNSKGGPTGADGDAALGDRGPRQTDTTINNTSPAPSVEPADANPENRPVP